MQPEAAKYLFDVTERIAAFRQIIAFRNILVFRFRSSHGKPKDRAYLS